MDGLAGTAQSSVASSTDVVVSVHLLFQCSEACYYDERCVSFEWDPASGDCKPLNLLPGESTAILQSNLSKPSVDNRTPIPGRLKDCAEACHVDLQCGYFLWNATTDECTLHHTGKDGVRQVKS
ncbi:hypothetical protein WJX75_005532 [Coccomyxa subellipsoidea]|uniref:Apple domain-containing protein n=1 Tax=Coccomyxa subellipsoidea TaxID=248742 RepID=A0ABR2YGL8_9CHLO